jgi:tetratricopeptide (TPR) repeat protein
MSVDRTATLRAAEKSLRLGKLPAAILEYTRLVQADPADSEAAMALAGLHLRAGDTDAAINHFTAAADALRAQDQLSRASELYARVLAIDAGNEHALGQAADLAGRAGDTAAAGRYCEQLADCQISRGDRAAAADTLSRLLALDPTSETTRGRIFNLSLESGSFERAREHAVTTAQQRRLAGALLAAGQNDEAAIVLRSIIDTNPDDRAAVVDLARVLVARGEAMAAAEIVSFDMAGDDSDARLAVVELLFRGGKPDAALDAAEQTLAADASTIDALARLAGTAASHVPGPAFALLEMTVRHWTRQSMWEPAASALQQFVARAPSCTDALVRLVEIAVDGQLTAAAAHAQEMLADAYLAGGSIEEGLAIAEDLVAREPGNPLHVARVRLGQELQRENASKRERMTPPPPDASILPFRVSSAS